MAAGATAAAETDMAAVAEEVATSTAEAMTATEAETAATVAGTAPDPDPTPGTETEGTGIDAGLPLLPPEEAAADPAPGPSRPRGFFNGMLTHQIISR